MTSVLTFRTLISIIEGQFEYVAIFKLSHIKKGVVEHLVDSEALSWVSAEHAFKQILAYIIEVIYDL